MHVPPRSRTRVVTVAHLVELAGKVEGVHHLPAGPVRMIVDDAHHGADALVERAVGAVRLQLVVLHEVDPGFAELLDHGSGRLGIESHARLDDGADQGAAVNVREPACAFDSETRAGIGFSEGGRQANVEQAQAADVLQLEQVAGHGRDEVRQGGAERRQRPRQGHERARDALAGLWRGRRGEGAMGDLFVEDDEPGHAGGGPLLELRRLARNGNEGAARLLAGDDLGRAFGGDRGLEQIIGFDAVGQHGCS